MWLKREEYERLVKQAAQADSLNTALVRAEQIAEEAKHILAAERVQFERDRLHWANMAASELAAERERGIQERADHYKLIKAMTDRHYTSQVKTYAVSQELEPPQPQKPTKGFTHDPTEIDLAKLEYYKQCAVMAGKPEEDAILRWEAEMRGEPLPIEYEAEQ